MFDVFVDSLDPDSVSVSHGHALQFARSFMVPEAPDSDYGSPVMIAGWRTYLAARLQPNLAALKNLPVQLLPRGHGIIVEHDSGINDFTVEDANEIARRLEKSQ